MERTGLAHPAGSAFADSGDSGSICFSKMSGHGNDFVIIDNREDLPGIGWPSLAVKLCDRSRSIGADGLLSIEQSDQADFRLRIFNADGSEARMCGNGARCAALWAVKKKIVPPSMNMETGAGAVKAVVDGNWASIKLAALRQTEKSTMLSLGDLGRVWCCGIDSGVPHAILFAGTDREGLFFDTRLEDVPGTIIRDIGSAVRHHPHWGEGGANTDFVEIIDGRNIFVRTYERGVEAETQACGTGAVASAFASKLARYVEGDSINVHMPGGVLSVFFQDNGDAWLAGAVLSEYDGRVTLPSGEEV